MKKIIRMTEADLTKLVQRVIQEQSQVPQIKTTSVMTDPNEWFSKFPCIKNLPANQQKIVGGKIYVKDRGGKRHVFLPETGTYQEQGYKEARENAVNGYVGKLQGGGFYYCSSASYAKGMGPILTV